MADMDTTRDVRVGWVSDVHLNFVDPRGVRRFFRELAAQDADAWLLTGDIAEARSLAKFLQMFEGALSAKTFFVLGNHDFYGAALKSVRCTTREFVSRSQRLVWLTDVGPQQLSSDVAIVGDDGWADGRLGNPLGTPVELADFFAIEDLAGLDRRDLVWNLRELGDSAAGRLEPKLRQAATTSRRVIVLTHVPPFWEASWHEGHLSDRDWVPWFTCSAVGDALMACAAAHPEVSFTVLCGHTHSSGVCSPAPNLLVYTAQAEYGTPHMQAVFGLGDHAAKWIRSG